MSSQTQEACVQRLLDLFPLYVRQDARSEVQRVVVPYVRSGSRNQEEDVTQFLAKMTREQKVRDGFYKLVRELRRGKVDVEAAYTTEFQG